VLPEVVPQLVADDGTRALRQAIADPDRFACEPKVDGVRGLVVYQPGGILEIRNRKGEGRDWLRGDSFETGLRRLGGRLPNVWDGTVLDGELTAGRFEGTMAALLDVPISWTLMFRTCPGDAVGCQANDKQDDRPNPSPPASTNRKSRRPAASVPGGEERRSMGVVCESATRRAVSAIDRR
jgi:hypothetical protein